MRSLHGQGGDDSKEVEEKSSNGEKEKLLGIHTQDDMDKVLWNWHLSKPPLSLRKPEANDDDNKKANGMKTGYDNMTFTTDQKVDEKGHNTSKNGNSYINGNTHMNQHGWDAYDHSSSIKKKEWAVYYSKV